jgi:hypothetical protein
LGRPRGPDSGRFPRVANRGVEPNANPR